MNRIPIKAAPTPWSIHTQLAADFKMLILNSNKLKINIFLYSLKLKMLKTVKNHQNSRCGHDIE